MLKFNYYSPTRIVFGAGTVNEIGTLIREFKVKKVAVVFGGNSAKKSGLLDIVEDRLKSEGIDVILLGGVVPNPLLSKAKEMTKEAVKFGAEFVLAVGGGSVIDTAKFVAIGVASPDTDIEEFFFQRKKVEKSLPIGTVLTIAAAGSETSDSAVLTDDVTGTHIKKGITTDYNRCKFAIMDPELTYTLPKYQIGAGVADIFMHTSERYFTDILGNHLTDEMAEGLFRDIIKFGPIGVKSPTDYEAMSEIMWCGSVSHIGLTGLGAKGDTPRDGDWSCHQLGMAISALFDSTHGATLSAIWASWANYVKDANIQRFAEFARKVYGTDEADDEKCANKGIEKTVEFFESVGMPVNLHDLLNRDVSEKDCEELAINCSYKKSRSIGSFKSLSYDDMYNIYMAAR
ncbi:putative NADH-dependent butanol dehydrogenase A [Lachnoanaerobaculum saburreum F0468]|uniref:Putative NADH-dependent butanol dehydrogenase A n=1 Tax=Lachnoanaerobaculum saburreum F0468 TaxID=1095750 RepID=I0R8X9_9FIRM|nr:iron-containing alcohol dehydrogenase [Lachnoanaerobaculum saburreum]EIC96137.1 putative NADH-dependent butanol dehydrogenase A [Lachnoanaerobaculum saburreum F0468]